MGNPVTLSLKGLAPIIAVQNQIIPSNGPKTIPIIFDFTLVTNTSDWSFDLLSQDQNTKFDFVQGIYIDNSLNSNAVTVVAQQTQQRIIAAGLSQGYYPIFAPNPPRFTVTSVPASTASTMMQFYKVHIVPNVWSTSAGGSFPSNVVNGNQLQNLPYTFTNGDVIKPIWIADRNVNVIGGPSTATIITGAPGWFLNWLDISITPDAAISGGAALMTITVSETASSIFRFAVYVPTVSLATPIVLPKVCDLKNLNINSKVAASILNVTCSPLLTSGSIRINAGVGTTSIVG